MNKILFFVLSLFCFSSFALAAANEEGVTYTYFSNKVTIDNKLSKLKAMEVDYKKKIVTLENEISVLNKKTAVFGEKSEGEHIKITNQRDKLNKTIQEKRAKIMDLSLELIKVSDEMDSLNNSIFEEYVANMKRIDDFVFSAKYIEGAKMGINRLTAQLKEVFKLKMEKEFSLAAFLKILSGALFIFFAFKIIMEAREKLDAETLPNLRFWIKNLNFLLFPFGLYACSYFLFSFNFVVNGALYAICIGSILCVFLRKRIESNKILGILSIVFGFHVLFENMSGIFDTKLELVLIVSALLVLVESFLGFMALKDHKALRWIFAFPLLLVMSGYVTLANIILYRAIIIAIGAVMVTTFDKALKELLLIFKTKISKHFNYNRVRILLEVITFMINLYFFAMMFLFTIGLRKSQIIGFNRILLFELKVGNINLSLTNIGLSLAVFFGIILFVKAINRRIEKSNIDESIKYSVSVGFKYIAFIIAILIFLTMLGVTFTSITIIAGALSVGIGFGLQNIVNNFVSGVIILFERPIKVGDWVAFSDGNEGTVRSISIRTTTIETFQKAHIIVPNADILSSSFINWTRKQPFNRIEIAVSVTSDTNPKIVKEAMLEIAKQHHKILEIPAPVVVLKDWHDNGLAFELRCFIKDTNDRVLVASDLRFSMIETFEKYGIKHAEQIRNIKINDNAKNIKEEHDGNKSQE